MSPPAASNLGSSQLVYIETLLEGKLKAPALIDHGASVTLISLSLVEQLNKQDEVTESLEVTSLVGAFSGTTEEPFGEIKLNFTIGDQQFHNVAFLIADLQESDTIILGQSFWQQQRSVLRNTMGSYAFYLNGKKIPVLADSKEKSVNRVVLKPETPPSLTEGRTLSTLGQDSFVNQEVTVYREVTIGPHRKLLVKVLLPDKAPAGQKVLIEEVGPPVSFHDQFETVLTGQEYGKHDRSCLKQTCRHGKSYKFTYITVENKTGEWQTLRPGKVIGLASQSQKAHVASVRRSVQKAVAQGLPDYFDKDRVAHIIRLLKGKCPDQPRAEKFMANLFSQFPQTVYLEGEALSVTDLIEHHISHSGGSIWIRQRPIALSRLQGLLKTVDSMLGQGTLLPSDSD